jgi:hypothetical protein
MHVRFLVDKVAAPKQVFPASFSVQLATSIPRLLCAHLSLCLLLTSEHIITVWGFTHLIWYVTGHRGSSVLFLLMIYLHAKYGIHI